MLKFLHVVIIALFPVLLQSQTKDNNSILLKWKLQPKEVISYQTIMDMMDTPAAKIPLDSVEKIFSFPNDTLNLVGTFLKKLLSETHELSRDINVTTTLSNNGKGFIDIEMVSKVKERVDTSKKEAKDTLKSTQEKKIKEMKEDVMVRGAITENGTIQSFYVDNNQKNLISLFFELPNKPIKIGDSWSLDIHFITLNESFKCDTSFKKNNITLIDIKKVGSETIAVIKYDIIEFVSGDFYNRYNFGEKIKKIFIKTTFKGIGEFSVDKGRWISFDGVKSTKSVGHIGGNYVQKFSLLP